MTWWGPRAVAGFAKAAGFDGDDLTTAVAVALTGSEGHDTAEFSTLTPPRRFQRGLWLIPLGAALDDPDGTLWHPAANAAMAYALTVTAGAGWQWSTVWRAGAWARRLDAAAAAAAHPETSQPPTVGLIGRRPADGGRQTRIILDRQLGKVW